MLDKIKELRDKTNVSVMACKKALDEAKGDIEKASLLLKKQGLKIAEKKSDRDLKAGIIESYIHPNNQVGVLLEARSETDFVAKNDAFKAFAYDVAMHIAALNPENSDELLGQEYIKNPSMTIKDYLNEMIQKFGENIEVSHFARFAISGK